MKPSSRIELDCWILSQLFEGYGGYVYEAANRWSKSVYFIFVFKGEKWPDDKTGFEIVMDLVDGIHWLKNNGYLKENVWKS
ncbi:MAG: hypothetical protein LBM08_15135 [Dysgonamonadaceae bacterium]|nr:hypothetical protein [Dysgonamonadaceae bacterium]